MAGEHISDEEPPLPRALHSQRAALTTSASMNSLSGSCRSRDITPRVSECGAFVSPFDRAPSAPRLPPLLPPSVAGMPRIAALVPASAPAAGDVTRKASRTLSGAATPVASASPTHAPGFRWNGQTVFKVMGLLCALGLVGLLLQSPLALFKRSLLGGLSRPVVFAANVSSTPPAVHAEDEAVPSAVFLPEDFSWQAYLAWNWDLSREGVSNRATAEEHFVNIGAAEGRLYKDMNVTLRYTACGGLFNQQYSHLSALALAVLLGAKGVIWPPLQERASFAKRFHPDPKRNQQTWQYLDASLVWHLPGIARNMQKKFNLTVTKHASACPIPDMREPDTAFQLCDVDDAAYDAHVSFVDPVYAKRLNPRRLVELVHVTLRDAMVMGGPHPTNVLLDLPCTFFMLDTRGLNVMEDIAKALPWAPKMTKLATQVVEGFKADAGSSATYNGLHLRLERDAVDWAEIVGGIDALWGRYKSVLARANFARAPQPLYIASGLIRAAGLIRVSAFEADNWSRALMIRVADDIIKNKIATTVVYKEKYLSATELADVSNEQSALIDFLVLRRSQKFVGIGLSTFSFYIEEDRLMSGRDPTNTEMLMIPYIGTDELFFASALVATNTRERLQAQARLRDSCKRNDGQPCFSLLPLGRLQPMARRRAHI